MDSRETDSRDEPDSGDAVFETDSPHARTPALPPGAHCATRSRRSRVRTLGLESSFSDTANGFVTPKTSPPPPPPPPVRPFALFATRKGPRAFDAFFFASVSAFFFGGVRGALPSNAEPKRRAPPFFAFLRFGEMESFSASRTALSNAEFSTSSSGAKARERYGAPAGGRGAKKVCDAAGNVFANESADSFSFARTFSGKSFPPSVGAAFVREPMSLCVRPALGPFPGRGGRGRVASEDDDEHSGEASRGGGRGASANVVIRLFSQEVVPLVPLSETTDEALRGRDARICRTPASRGSSAVRSRARLQKVETPGMPPVSPNASHQPGGSASGVAHLFVGRDVGFFHPRPHWDVFVRHTTVF